MASLIKAKSLQHFWFRNLSSNTRSSSVVTSPSYFVVSLRRLRHRRGQSPFPVYFVSLCLCRAISRPSLVHLGIFTFTAPRMIPQITWTSNMTRVFFSPYSEKLHMYALLGRDAQLGSSQILHFRIGGQYRWRVTAGCVSLGLPTLWYLKQEKMRWRKQLSLTQSTQCVNSYSPQRVVNESRCIIWGAVQRSK